MCKCFADICILFGYTQLSLSIFKMRIFTILASVAGLGQAAELDYAKRVELLEQKIAQAEKRVIELLERRNRKPFGDFYPTLDSCADGNNPSLEQLWNDACRLSDAYESVNNQVIQFSEAANNKIEENKDNLEVVPLFIRQLKQNYGTLNVNTQTIMSKVGLIE